MFQPEEEVVEIPANLFDIIVGYEDKASAKTPTLEDLHRLPLKYCEFGYFQS